MDRIKKKLRQIPIPAAFVLCGMAALLCALSLTRATMWFAQKNKGEIAAGYVELAAIPSKEAPLFWHSSRSKGEKGAYRTISRASSFSSGSGPKVSSPTSPRMKSSKVSARGVIS